MKYVITVAILWVVLAVATDKPKPPTQEIRVQLKQCLPWVGSCGGKRFIV